MEHSLDSKSFLIIKSSVDDKPVSEDWLKEEENINLLVDSLSSSFDEAHLIFEDWIETDIVCGKFIGFGYTQNEEKGICKMFMYPSYEDNSWVMIGLYESKASEYYYGSDYYNLLINIKEK